MIVVEAKDWDDKIPSHVVNNFAGKVDAFNATYGFIVTTSEFTRTDGALDSIVRHSSQNKLIIPLEDRMIIDFFNFFINL